MLAKPAGCESVVELRIENIALLFDPLDPFPTPSRDLSRATEEFIVGWARELLRGAQIRLVLHVSSLGKHDASEVQTAFSNHFRQRERGLKGDISELFRVGRTSLMIGLATLTVCVLLGQAASILLGPGSASRILSEGLIILGWVANWRPLEIFLYDWWPLAQRRRLFRRLSDAPVEVRTD